jgi:hypothetical protein
MLATFSRTSGARCRTLVFTLCLAIAPAVATAEEPAPAGEVEPGSTPATTTEPSGPNAGKVAFSVASDFTTAYFFRGILQERDGFIWQPYGGVTFTLAEDVGYGVINSIALALGTWNSVHTKQTLATSSPKNWYESDVIAGFNVGLWDFVTTNISYVAYTYPNGAFATVQELDWTIAFNDSELLGPFALNPSMLWAFEVDNTAFGDGEGIYLGLGAKPGVTLFEEAEYPLTLALPLTVGLSVSDYYEEPGGDDDTFGYFDAGIVASVPLTFIDSAYGSWSASASFDVLALSGTLARANRSDGTFFVGKGGIAFSY